MNIIKVVIEARGIANPVQLCSLSSVGACDSVKGGKCHNISCLGGGGLGWRLGHIYSCKFCRIETSGIDHICSDDNA